MKKRRLLNITILILICLLTSCANNEFNTNYKHFKESYVLATDFVEKDNDSLKALKKMDITAVEAELKKMEEIMDKMDTESKSKNEEGIYDNVKSFYQEVEFLLYAAKNIETLSTDEKIKVDTKILLAIMHRKSIEEGEV